MPGMAPVETIHFTDPSCPWAYSAEPFMRALEWRFGEHLQWRTVMIGLSEDTTRSAGRGMTPESRASSWGRYSARYGMPVLGEPRSRLLFSGRACRAVVAARQQSPALADRYLRRIRLAWFTSTLLLDDDAVLVELAATVPGLDAGTLEAALRDPATEAAYQADRDETRTAAEIGRPAIAQGRTASSDGPERFTAPSLVFRAGGRSLVAGGWQSLAAYDVCIANLEPDLPRRPAPGLAEALAAFPDGLTTAEVARVCADRNVEPDIAAVAGELAALVDAGELRREPLGSAELWLAP
jgi:2-hydroxychromene-2-carboxylate isomerase